MGIDHRGDEVMTQLGQQWNGLPGNTSGSSPKVSPRPTDTGHIPGSGPPKDKPGGVVSSTPLKAESHGLPSLSESPVPASQR